MTIIDPHDTLPRPISGPFDNAYAVDMEALRAGNTIELPFVSSRLIIGGQLGRVIVACKVRPVGECNTPDGTTYITLKSGQTLEVPMRVTHILPINTDDIEQSDPDKPLLVTYPSTITALW
ncbi:MAG: hypothetical protein JSR78_06505 [Proteobacteria bacterium]|nr:hypothetical protein [Pseudomonadota bacterium]